MKAKIKQLLLLALALITLCLPCATSVEAAASFPDIGNLDIDPSYLDFLLEKEIIKGYPDGTFRPDNSISREEIAIMIARALPDLQPGSLTMVFTDLSDVDDPEAQAAIKLLSSNGIISGYMGTTLFGPEDPAERSHVAKMVVKALNLTQGEVKKSFTDISGLHPDDQGYINILASRGIVSGWGNTSLFRPGAEITRAHFAKILAGAMGFEPPEESSSVLALRTAEHFNANARLSRARLEEQLVYDGFSLADISYAMNAVGFDGRLNALQTAKNYNAIFHLSKTGLKTMLQSDGAAQFSEAEAQYAVDNVGADWKQNALLTARSYRTYFGMANDAIYTHLVSGDQFTAAEAQYAINNLN